MNTSFNAEDPFQFESDLPEEDRMIMQTAREYAQSELEPRALDGNQEEYFDPAIPGEMAELGLLGVMIDEEFGGAGASQTAYGLIAREIERVDSGYRSFMSVQSSLVMHPIQKFGTEQQKRNYLPKLASADLIGCFGLTEPDHGSDPGSLETTAIKTDGGWVLNGNKMWITNSPIADVAIVWAKAKERKNEEGSIRGFIVDADSDGYSAPKTKGKMSLRASETGEINLEDVFVPDENVFPEVRGLKGPFTCLNSARYGIAWGTVGSAEFCYRKAREYALNRKQFGKPIASTQLVQTKLANMLTDITAMQMLVRRLGQLRDEGRDHPSMISLSKRNNAKKAQNIARKSRDIHGGNGIMGEYRVIHQLMNMETVVTYEGTHDIHGLILGREITGHAAF